MSAECLNDTPELQNELFDDLKISNQTAHKYKYPGQIWTAVIISYFNFKLNIKKNLEQTKQTYEIIT